MLRRKSGRANTSPMSTRHATAENGSATSPRIPSFMKVAGMPSTVSAPNQVANTVATTMGVPKRRPRDGEVRGTTHARGRIKAHRDRGREVQQDEEDQHDWTPAYAGVTLMRR